MVVIRPKHVLKYLDIRCISLARRGAGGTSSLNKMPYGWCDREILFLSKNLYHIHFKDQVRQKNYHYRVYLKSPKSAKWTTTHVLLTVKLIVKNMRFSLFNRRATGE